MLPGYPLVPRGAGGPEGLPSGARWQSVPCRCGGGCPPPSFPASWGLSVCLCVASPVPTPPCPGVPQGSPIPSPVFISRCTTGTVTPNKTAMGSSSVATSGVSVEGTAWGVVAWGTTGWGARGSSAQQPQHSQGSALPADEGTAEHGEDTPGDESGPAGTRAGGRWDRASPG